jgi:Concanavalin A-like lectin/glucanases superfamily
MKLLNFALIVLFCAGLLFACTKNTNPKTIYDTVTVTKTDTITEQLPPPNDTPNLTSGLLIYLPFTNGSYADSSGNNNTVTAVGGATLGYDIHGYAQSAYNGTGNGGYLMVTSNNPFNLDTAFAVSFDFMTRVSQGSYYCCGNYDGLPVFLSIVDVTNGNGPTFDCGFTIPAAPQYFSFGVNSSSSSCDSSGDDDMRDVTDTSYTFAPQIGSWYNAILEFSHGTLSTYINGQLISSKTSTTDSVLSCPNASFVVGGWWGGHNNFNGELDQVRLYNHTLTPQQIAWLSRNFLINSNRQLPSLQGRKSPTIN